MRAFTKDILRTIRKEKKRLIALIVISALGVTMMTGLKASCDDLRSSADSMFDRQALHDLSVVSTLGLTSGDVSALEKLDCVDSAEGRYSESVQINDGTGYSDAVIKTFSPSGLDVPHIINGRLPSSSDEIAVTESYLKDSGRRIGDTIRINEDLQSSGTEEKNLLNNTYKITGAVIDVTNVVNPDGSTSFRSSGNDEYECFVISSAVKSDYFTSVDISVKGARDLNTFSDEYASVIAKAKKKIEDKVMDQRQASRYSSVYGKAEQKLADAKNEADGEFSKAEADLANAKNKLIAGRNELIIGQNELEAKKNDAEKSISAGKKEIAENRKIISDGYAELQNAEQQLNKSEVSLDQNEAKLKAAADRIKAGKMSLEQAEQQLTAQQEAVTKPILEGIEKTTAGIAGLNEALYQLDNNISDTGSAILSVKEQIAEAESGGDDPSVLADLYGQLTKLELTLTSLKAQKDKLNAEKAALETVLSGLKSALDQAEAGFAPAWEKINAEKAIIAASEAEIAAGEKAIIEGRMKISAARKTIAEKRAAADAGMLELDAAEDLLSDRAADASARIAAAEKKLADGWLDIETGSRELADGTSALNKSKAEAYDKFAEAEAKLDDIEKCVWYIRDRTALDGYSAIASDADSIESIGTVFPIIFLLVAILISLTTITRMVDENRGLIGTYQALGFTDSEIRRRFVIYSSFACLIGGLIGNIGGYVILPEILFIIFKTMYLLPVYILGYNTIYGIGGILLFYAAIVGTTVISCNSAVREMPAALMRPKPPQSGSRIFLERITPLWKRLSFMNKATARNLFRYKKRFIMTVFGIASCTALLLAGLSVKDTVADLMPRQYEHIISYDILAVTQGGDDFDAMQKFLNSKNERVGSSQQVEVTTVDVHNKEGKTLAVQMYVIPEGADLDDYFSLRDTDGKAVSITGSGYYLTQNIKTILGVDTGDTVKIQDMALNEDSGKVLSLLENYLGNSVFVTQKFYDERFGSYSPNAELITLTRGTNEADFVKELKKQDEILSVTSVKELKDGFGQTFKLMNLVVYMVIVLAGALAFVVLFTLSTTNISERDRELATIKVLGFHNTEVHNYVNKETLILTVIGIIGGLPLGVLLGHLLGMALKIPAIVFSTVVAPVSFVIAAGMAFGFAILVDIVTNRILDRIDPIEALKSVE